MKTRTKVWVTKFWLTDGIFVSQGGKFTNPRNGVIFYVLNEVDHFFRVGTDCFESEAEAKAHVQQEAQKKIESLEAELLHVKQLLTQQRKP